jgi:hypothetical protein
VERVSLWKSVKDNKVFPQRNALLFRKVIYHVQFDMLRYHRCVQTAYLDKEKSGSADCSHLSHIKSAVRSVHRSHASAQGQRTHLSQMQLVNTSPLRFTAQRSHKLVSQRLKAKLFARLAFAAVHARGEDFLHIIILTII